MKEEKTWFVKFFDIFNEINLNIFRFDKTFNHSLLSEGGDVYLYHNLQSFDAQ
jgi:hypothetical protein